MTVERADTERVLAVSRACLGIPAEAELAIDDVFLAATIRRAAGILCPCPPSAIVGIVLQTLQHVVPDVEQLRSRLDEILEMLVAGGDLLELDRASLGDGYARSTWLFAAPPSFVERPDHSVAVIGIAPDEASPLPETLASRIVYEGATRTIYPAASDQPSDVLRRLGLVELSLSGWLKTPRCPGPPR